MMNDPYVLWKFPPLFIKPLRVEHHSQGLIRRFFNAPLHLSLKIGMSGLINEACPRAVNH